MSNIFSEEMKKELMILIDKRIVKSGIAEILDTHKDVSMDIEKNVKEINDRLVDVEDTTNDFENDIDRLQNDLKETVSEDDIEELVGTTMLKLMPNFNEKISREIKKHLVAIAEFVIKNFKEKD